MNSAMQLIRTAMPELRARYAARLRTQSNELLDFISRCERGKLSEEVCQDTRTLVHSLRGTGSTFGFAEISEAAKYLEDALNCGPPHNVKTFVNLTLELIRACNVDEEPAAAMVELPPQIEGASLVERPLLLTVSGSHASSSGRRARTVRGKHSDSGQTSFGRKTVQRDVCDPSSGAGSY
jgi:chemotaxis protein histidine kinase CheA